MERVHATCVSIDGQGVLLRGPSGAGKSDLALRLLDSGAELVADDYTELSRDRDQLRASAPAILHDLFEVRGLGVLRLAARDSVVVAAIVDLVPESEVERMPADDHFAILGVSVPLFRLAAFEASAPAKVRLAVRIASGSIMRPE
ncbi:MAG: HPr kinase/phosphatase C-terminal domain-containing protein [Defluviicoccus sp.]